MVIKNSENQHKAVKSRERQRASPNRPFLAQQALIKGKCRLVAKTESVDGGGLKGRRGVKLPNIPAAASKDWQFDTPQSASLTAPLL